MQRTFTMAQLFSLVLIASACTIASAQNYFTPTDEHAALAEDVGVWEGEVTMWAEKDAEPMKSTGVETNEMMGKMWLMSKYEGDMGGQKFEGRSAVGYDPVKKKYTGGWIDTMSPFMMKLEGTYDDSTHTLTMSGESTSVMTGKPEKFKLVTKWEGEDKKTFELHTVDGEDSDKGFKMMEIKYTRKK